MNQSELRYLVEHRFGLEKVCRLMQELKCLGHRTREFIKDELAEEFPGSTTQYIAACVLSYSEVDQVRNDIFEDAWEFLESGDARCPQTYVSFERAAVVMNHPETLAHGEVRLLDPRGRILNYILPHTIEMNDGIHEENLMAKMNRRFRQSEYWWDSSIVFLISHFIPCTEEDHMCSAVIREYVRRAGAYVVIACENMYEGTDTAEALANLEHENIYVLDLTPIQQPSYHQADIVHFEGWQRRRRRRRRAPIGMAAMIPSGELGHLNLALLEIADDCTYTSRRGLLHVTANVKPW